MNSIEQRDPDGFKIPSAIPQDILLIQNLVEGNLPEGSPSSRTDVPSATRAAKTEEDDTDSVTSSSSENLLDEGGDVDMLKGDATVKKERTDKGADSEEEVEAGLLGGGQDGEPMTMPDSSPENSDSDTSDSDSDDPSDVEEFDPAKARELLDSIDDEDDEGGASGGRPVTVHEALNEEVAIPDITEVDPKEALERVGEIVSVLQDKVVIVKGLASQVAGRASERVLDIDTLLVYEDRKVLGYIHETFGPTHQPLYQIRFNDRFPLDKERAQVLRPIFHVPNRSNFVFVDRLKLAKGSDASNAHDEEPGEDEVEFSDDEQEAAYKRMLKERRSSSRASSRATTPGAAARRDHDQFDDTFGGNNPYDEHGVYDTNYGAGPSRPPPIPYDDPYSDSFAGVSDDGDGGDSTTSGNDGGSIRSAHVSHAGSGTNVRPNDRNLNPGLRHHHTRGRGRGGSRNRQSDRGRRGRGRGGPQHPQRHQTFPQQSDSQDFSGWTPPSGFLNPYSYQPGYGDGGEWNYGAPPVTPPPPVYGFGSQNTFSGVQPHINPRFANQLGFNFSQMSQIPQISPGVGLPAPSEQYDYSESQLQATAHHHQWEEGSGHSNGNNGIDP